MINHTVLVGRLTRDIELKYTGGGTAVANFTIACNRPFKSADGKEEADFINCVVWRKAAENMSEYTRKGSLIGVTGRIQTRNYEGNDGKKVYVTEVVCDNVQYLDTKETSGSDKPAKKEAAAPVKDYPEFNKDVFNKDDTIDITDDDLPF